MELVTVAILGVGSVLGAVLVHLIAGDVHAWLPHLASRLVRRAARMVPEVDQERYREEWLAHLDECVGAFSKLRHGVEVLFSANVLRKVYLNRPVRVEIGGYTAAVSIPAAIALVCTIGGYYKDQIQEL